MSAKKKPVFVFDERSYETGSSALPAGSELPAPSGWDAAVSAVDSYNHEIKILQEALRIIEQNELPRHTWHTWDVFAGRMDENLEATDRWTVRVLQQARENVKHPNEKLTQDARP